MITRSAFGRRLLLFLLVACSIVPVSTSAAQEHWQVQQALHFIKPFTKPEAVRKREVADFLKQVRAQMVEEDKLIHRTVIELGKLPGARAGAYEPAWEVNQRALRFVEAWRLEERALEEFVMKAEFDTTHAVHVFGQYQAGFGWAEERVLVAAARVQTALAELHVSQTLGEKDSVRYAQVRLTATQGRMRVAQRLASTIDAYMTLLEQGTREEYIAHHAMLVSDERKRLAAELRQREALTAAANQRLVAKVAGYAALLIASDQLGKAKAYADKVNAPDYDVIMAQTREAYRQACEARGLAFVAGQGDDPGTCVRR